jgi:hypothetical protein
MTISHEELTLATFCGHGREREPDRQVALQLLPGIRECYSGFVRGGRGDGGDVCATGGQMCPPMPERAVR